MSQKTTLNLPKRPPAIDTVSPVELWACCIAAVVDTGCWTEDDGVRLKELLGLRYRIRCGAKSLADARALANSALPPFRQGVIDSTGGGTDYWSIIGTPDTEGSLAQVISQLRNKTRTKQASLAITHGPHGVPCLVNLDFKIRDKALWTSAMFRSQDVFRRQPNNISFLCEVADRVGAVLGVRPHSIDVLVASAHVYEPDLKEAVTRFWNYARDRRPDASMQRPIAIAVIGKERLYYDNPDHAGALSYAYRVGMYLATHGAVIVTGGLGGIMEAASNGANAVGGIAIGIVPEILDDEGGRRKPNSIQSLSVVTSLDQRARMPMIIDSVDAVLVVHGGGGTRVEAEMALSRGVPVVTLSDSGGVADELSTEQRDGLFTEADPTTASTLCLELAHQHRLKNL